MAPETKKVESSPEVSTYYISFVPGEDLLKNGANPMFLLDDLLELGRGLVLTSVADLPDPETFQITACYTSFGKKLNRTH